METKNWTIKCDSCGFSATATSEDLAKIAAMQHVGDAHKDTNAAHMLGQHMHVTRTA
jgi:hypothetical protein